MVVEVYYSYFHVSYYIYRLTCLRYLFLIYLGLIWSRKGILLNPLTMCLSLLSVILMFIIAYTDISLQPILSDFGWKEAHWLCYFYPAFLYIHIVNWVYNKLSVRLKGACIVLGKYSWEIFLMQMLFFTLVGPGKFDIVDNKYVTLLLYTMVALVFSIVPVLILKQIKIRR